MKKYILHLLIIVFTLLATVSCNDEEVKRDKEVVQVEGEGIIINKESIIIDLEEIDVVDVVVEDIVTYNDEDFSLYEVKIEGSIGEAEQIEVGTVINLPLGDKGGQVMLFDLKYVS